MTWDMLENWVSIVPWLVLTCSVIGIGMTVWVVHREKFVRLRLETGYIAPTSAIQLTVINKGSRKANVTDIYLKTGRFWTTRHVPLSSQLRHVQLLPAGLNDGDIVHFELAMEATASQLKDLLKKTSWWNGGASPSDFLRTVKLGIQTSTGTTVEARLSRDKAGQFQRYYRLVDQNI